MYENIDSKATMGHKQENPQDIKTIPDLLRDIIDINEIFIKSHIRNTFVVGKFDKLMEEYNDKKRI